MLTSISKASSLLLLLASSAQCFTTTSSPSLVSFFDLPSISPNPFAFLEGPVGDPDSVSLFHVTKDKCMRYRKATKSDDGSGQYVWAKRNNIGGSFQAMVPAAVTYKDTSVVFGIGTTTNLYYSVYESKLDDYKEWVNLEGGCLGSPQAVYLPKKGEIVVLVRGGDGGFYHRIGTPDTSFSSYVRLPGGYLDDPKIAAFTDSSGQENVIVNGIGGDNYFYYHIYCGGKWDPIVRSSLGAPEGWESVNVYPYNYDSEGGYFKGVTLIGRTKTSRVVYAKFDKSTGWTNFIDFPYEIPSKCHFGDLNNGTNVYSTSKDGFIYLSSFGRSICGNKY